jgi:hypothetical protein
LLCTAVTAVPPKNELYTVNQHTMHFLQARSTTVRSAAWSMGTNRHRSFEKGSVRHETMPIQ